MKNSVTIIHDIENRMKSGGLPELAIKTFERYYQLLVDGETGMIQESCIQPVDYVPNVNQLGSDYTKIGEDAIEKTVIIKLNGGLGTSMGLEKAKSLVKVKGDKSFLDIIAEQTLSLKMPLVLMNSFSTHNDSLQSLDKYQELFDDNLLFSFIQHKVPKIDRNKLSPANYSVQPELEWCPPGHGDIYTSLITSNTLEQLLDSGYKYAFISNSDNLGAIMDAKILGYFVKHCIPFMMEVAQRTTADRKGGHLAKDNDGRLILREIAQCNAADIDDFQNINRYKYFNTNNIWINLAELKSMMDEYNNILPLPMIRNTKPVNPREPDSASVYQLETAMGSAINLFPEARALHVTRERFIPVKTTSDLLIVRSDLYTLNEHSQLSINLKEGHEKPIIMLDQKYFKMIDQFEERFPYGVPSLLECDKFIINGNIVFGKNNKLSGNIQLSNNSNHVIFLEDEATYSGN